MNGQLYNALVHAILWRINMRTQLLTLSLVSTLVISGPALSGDPECVKAWGELRNARMLLTAKTLVQTDCDVMYQKGWMFTHQGRRLPNSNVKKPECAESWNKLAQAKRLGAVQKLVTKKCPILKKKGWVKY